MSAARQHLVAYVLLLPAILIMTLSGILPMAFVAYYSVHDTFGGNSFIWVGAIFGSALCAIRASSYVPGTLALIGSPLPEVASTMYCAFDLSGHAGASAATARRPRSSTEAGIPVASARRPT